MNTPKQKRIRKEQPDENHFAPFKPVLLDEQFDEPSQADREWSSWKWPSRDDG